MNCGEGESAEGDRAAKEVPPPGGGPASSVSLLGTGAGRVGASSFTDLADGFCCCDDLDLLPLLLFLLAFDFGPIIITRSAMNQAHGSFDYSKD